VRAENVNGSSCIFISLRKVSQTSASSKETYRLK
jgi:hypothetical protein